MASSRNALLLALLLVTLTACHDDDDRARGTGGTNLTLQQPVDRGEGKLVFAFGSTYFEVTPGHGARITSLQHSGRELLFLGGAANYDDALGSTFWPSPQNWGWPPPADVDLNEYVATVEDERGIITAEGAADSLTNLKVSKRFSANLKHESVDIEYSMTNTGSEAAEWAPWEITRMPATGLAFWPTGGSPFGDYPLLNEEAAGHTWVDPAQTAGEGKLFADGGGSYVAYALGDRLLIKQFADQPSSAAAPKEAEIELYVNADHSYLEVENQGPYTSIAPGETVEWKVTWYARQLPAGVTASAGNPDLLAFAAQTLQ